jgi:hypothetical protein
MLSETNKPFFTRWQKVILIYSCLFLAIISCVEIVLLFEIGGAAHDLASLKNTPQKPIIFAPQRL